jgi:hypothetical protein
MIRTPDNSSAWEVRESVYRRLFGGEPDVWHEMTELDPHIDIYGFKPGFAGRDFVTLVTSGMSDRQMRLPAGMPSELQKRRVELVFYCASAKQEYAELLRRLAHYVFDNNTWLGAGHTMETHDIALLDSGNAKCLLFMPTPVIPDDSLPMRLQIDGDPVTLLWLVPITAEECALTRQGWFLRSLMRCLNRNGRPYVFDPTSRK